MTLGLKIRMWFKKRMIGTENMQYIRAFSPDELSRGIDMKNCIIYRNHMRPVLDEKYFVNGK